MGTVPELAENERIDLEFEVDTDETIRVIERREGDYEYPRYEFQAEEEARNSYDLGPEWDNPRSARLYACVYALVRFREEKTGRRGLPGSVGRYGQEATVAYMRCRSGVDAEWLSAKYDLPKQRVYEYCSRIRSEARDTHDLVVVPDDWQDREQSV